MKGKLNQVKIEQSFGKNKLQSKECSIQDEKSTDKERDTLQFKMQYNDGGKRDRKENKILHNEIFNILQQIQYI